MKTLDRILRFLGQLSEPLRQNAMFAVMMYLLGCVTAWLTIPDVRGAHLYENLYAELFFDIMLLCLLLRIIPRKIRGLFRALLYVVLYGLALVDVYCFVAYDTTLTPTVMMLLAETDSNEVREFASTLLSPDIIVGKVGWILLIILSHIAITVVRRLLSRRFVGVSLVPDVAKYWRALLGIACLAAFVWCGVLSWSNKQGVYRLMTAANIGEIEHILTEKDHGMMYQPPYRMAFSIYANSLTAQQIKKLQAAVGHIKVDSCSYTVPDIVLIIGESYSRHHSQQYGYWQPTTPRQVELEKTGRLVKFTDVVCPWNLTSFVFKHIFSTYTVGDKGEWCDYPLFPELFKAAGYHVTFLTNQFLPKAKEAVYDFSGGFFLNDPVLSNAQFDSRNTKKYQFDESLLDEYARLKKEEKAYNLTIFHLIGQHVLYRQRSPNDRKKFMGDEYKDRKPHLNARERKILADYDNSLLYNDSVVVEITRRFDNRDAIVIYVPDHGEECFEGDLHFYCRMHSTEITPRLAHAEFDIPFWIYCTPEFIRRHHDIYAQIVDAKDRRYMTDALPHMLLYLAGIHSKDYKEEHNILSPRYNEKRKRILKNTTDYDTL